jgi:hypothetical protein
VKQKAWVKDKVDEEIAKNDQVEEADETKQNAEYTLTINTCVNIIKIPNVFAKMNKFAEVFARDKSEEPRSRNVRREKQV